MSDLEHSDQPLQTPLPTDAPLTTPHLPRRSARRWLEPLAISIMALGAIMMFQPFAKILFTYSFIVILFGTLMFIVVSHMPE